MENVSQLLEEIRSTISQRTASQKDEVRVMKAMLNDRDYSVDIYGKDGVEGVICPAKEAREMITSVISAAAKIPFKEAQQLADAHEFKKSEASNMINISKEFVNTYLETSRKLPLGGRSTSDVSLVRKHVDATERSYPAIIGKNPDGTPIRGKGIAKIKEHDSVKVVASCPSWIK